MNYRAGVYVCAYQIAQSNTHTHTHDTTQSASLNAHLRIEKKMRIQDNTSIKRYSEADACSDAVHTITKRSTRTQDLIEVDGDGRSGHREVIGWMVVKF